MFLIWRNKHLSQKKSLVLFAIFLSPNITQKPDHHIVICLSCGLGVPSFLLFCVIYESSHLWVAAFTLPKCHKMTWDSKKLAKNFHFRGSYFLVYLAGCCAVFMTVDVINVRMKGYKNSETVKNNVNLVDLLSEELYYY